MQAQTKEDREAQKKDREAADKRAKEDHEAQSQASLGPAFT